ncbi:MAG: nucleotidyltransferase family protein [Microvirga sp.]
MKAPHALVLAAGAGRRFGGRKLLAPWQGAPLVQAALDAAAATELSGLTVVTGADAPDVAAAIGDWSRQNPRARVEVVHAPDHGEGLAASLRAGLRALPPHADGAVIFLGDMPCVPRGIVPDLLAALRPESLAAAPCFEGRRGHPVLVRSDLFEALLSLNGDAGARTVLDGLGERLVLVPAKDAGVLFDVDVVGDLRRGAGSAPA